MNNYKQLKTVVLWEYKRFFKIKNELIGIVVMVILSGVGFVAGKYSVSDSDEKVFISVSENLPPDMITALSGEYEIEIISNDQKEEHTKQIAEGKNELVFLDFIDNTFMLYAWKKSHKPKGLPEILNASAQKQAMMNTGVTAETLEYIFKPADLRENYFYLPDRKGQTIIAIFFAALMIIAVFTSFAYQFTAITGEKQLKITEQIVSAIKPQLWMDGKILGITLTGISSMLVYSLIGVLAGMLYFQFTGASAGSIMQYLHFPTIILYLLFALLGILMWNAFIASIASVITDPNNSGKSSLMLMPVFFVAMSFLILKNPDNGLSVFLSWFPLTSATAMPVRLAVTTVVWWQVAGSFILLGSSFFGLRILAARIFKFSILISGNEPTWKEVVKFARNK